jgi:hypothetical protein
VGVLCLLSECRAVRVRNRKRRKVRNRSKVWNSTSSRLSRYELKRPDLPTQEVDSTKTLRRT